MKILAISFLLLGLSGCTSLLTDGSATQTARLHQSCRQSSLLITDLTRPSTQRTYVLADGHVCKEY